MKTIKFIIAIGLLTSVFIPGYTQTKNLRAQQIDPTRNDSLTYNLVVFEPGYELFLLKQQPEQYYSEGYYKLWNNLYVMAWNTNYNTQATTGLYDNYIDYDPKIEYGKNLEYRLYYFFRYFEKKHHVILVENNH